MHPDLAARITSLEKKYFDLVWYARKPSLEDEAFWNSLTPDIRKGALIATFKVEETYPIECVEIADPDTGDWHHGFNSGMLAAMRYIMAFVADGQEQADASFPELDS